MEPPVDFLPRAQGLVAPLWALRILCAAGFSWATGFTSNWCKYFRLSVIKYSTCIRWLSHLYRQKMSSTECQWLSFRVKSIQLHLGLNSCLWGARDKILMPSLPFCLEVPAWAYIANAFFVSCSIIAWHLEIHIHTLIHRTFNIDFLSFPMCTMGCFFFFFQKI